MKKMIIVLCALLATLPAHAVDGEALLLDIDRRLQPESYEMYRKLINIEPDGDQKEYVLYTVKKGKDSVVALFLDPPSEKGRSSLRQGENMWLYIPNVGKPLRITSLQSVVGGVFNNSDLLRLDYSTEYSPESVAEEGDQFLLELKAKITESGAVISAQMGKNLKAMEYNPVQMMVGSGARGNAPGCPNWSPDVCRGADRSARSRALPRTPAARDRCRRRQRRTRRCGCDPPRPTELWPTRR